VARISDCQSEGAGSIPVSPARSFTSAWRGDVACRRAIRQATLGVGLMAMIAGCQPAGAGSIPVPPTEAVSSATRQPASGWKAHACSLTYWLNFFQTMIVRRRGSCLHLVRRASPSGSPYNVVSLFVMYRPANGAVGIRSFIPRIQPGCRVLPLCGRSCAAYN
jgi:hypothetical protein